jgi:hypothetical protein
MHRKITLGAAALAGLAALTFSLDTATAKTGGEPAVPLNNEQETTDPTTGASGFFSWRVEGQQFCYTLESRDLAVAATAAHVHVGARNVDGPVVIGLTVGSGTSWTVSACTTPSPDVLAAVIADPGAYYVNVHTSLQPGGEIRGQLK